jgi:hypothetical protein
MMLDLERQQIRNVKSHTAINTCVGYTVWSVMMRDGLHNPMINAPQAEKIGAYLCVCNPE